MTEALEQKIAFWELDPTDPEPVSVVPHPVEARILTSGSSDIGIFPPDARAPVQKAESRPGQKYHSIVKLFIRYQDQGPWVTATGWLIKDNLVVTAAHSILNGDEHATFVRVCIGYSAGSQHADTSFDAHRNVTRIALPALWKDQKADQSNTAFLQLDKAFQNVTPIKYGTPDSNSRQQQLTIAGYPADLGAKSGSPGKEIYRLQVSRDINLEQTRWNMLMYQGDTPGGLYGAPIIRDKDFVAIGVHVRGGDFNFGTVIGGQFGIDFCLYERALEMLDSDSPEHLLNVETDMDNDWLKYVHVS